MPKKSLLCGIARSRGSALWRTARAAIPHIAQSILKQVISATPRYATWWNLVKITKVKSKIFRSVQRKNWGSKISWYCPFNLTIVLFCVITKFNATVYAAHLCGSVLMHIIPHHRAQISAEKLHPWSYIQIRFYIWIYREIWRHRMLYLCPTWPEIWMPSFGLVGAEGKGWMGTNKSQSVYWIHSLRKYSTVNLVHLAAILRWKQSDG
jgi:hypothetical protein